MPKKSSRQKTRPASRRSGGARIRKAVIPVAGFGTRFLPATIAQPKEMLTVVDKPVIQYIVEEMAAAGIEEIIFVTGRNKRAIEDHFDYSPELEQSLRDSGKETLLKEVQRISRLAKFVYVRQNKMLGNGHALLMAREIVGDEPFAFSYGDDIMVSKKPAIRQVIDAYHRHPGIVLGVQPVRPEVAHRYGMLRPKGPIRGNTFASSGIAEKPKPGTSPSAYANFGRYVFTPEIFDYISKVKPNRDGEIFLAEAVNLYAKRQPFYGHILEGRYFDCGSKREYVKANIYFALKHREMRADIRAYLRKPV